MQRTFRGQGLVPGIAEAEALVTIDGIAFNLGVDEHTGIVIVAGHQFGQDGAIRPRGRRCGHSFRQRRGVRRGRDRRALATRRDGALKWS